MNLYTWATLIVCAAAFAFLIGFYCGGRFILKTLRERFDEGALFNSDQGEQPGTGSKEKS